MRKMGVTLVMAFLGCCVGLVACSSGGEDPAPQDDEATSSDEQAATFCHAKYDLCFTDSYPCCAGLTCKKVFSQWRCQ